MRKLVVLTFVSLDGVMQAPGGKGEDPSGGFDLEGWTVPFFEEVAGAEMGRQMTPPFDLLLGKTTFEIFAAYWPRQTSDPFAASKKYVVSNEPVDTSWHETVQVQGDVVGELHKLKQSDGPMLQVHGSSNLIQTLLSHELVDEFWLKIFPVTLGRGKRLFGAGVKPAAYKLTQSTVSPRGVIMARYTRDGEVKLGSFRDAPA